LTDVVTIIAEAGVNHNGDVNLAIDLVDAAAAAGADFVKFQTFDPESLAAPGTRKAEYQIATTGGQESQLEMLRKLVLSDADHRRLYDHCSERHIGFLATPFDHRSADMLADVGMETFKISSGDLTNIPLLEHVARLGRPMIVSTGMGDMGEVGIAMDAMRAAGAQTITLLHCVTEYPADPKDVNLRAMATMSAAFAVPVGYSDHTTGIAVSIGAVALGARVIEKHITLDRTLPGPDQAASLEPLEFEALVAGIRMTEQSLGDGKKTPSAAELRNRVAARRSVVAIRDIPVGSVLMREDLAIMRPGTGLPPADLERVIGARTRQEIPGGTVLSADMFE
tara:strand:+ start:9374 stop:10387 length:1014 start_codon:yes stop_codon:yes gene_type:complete